MARKTSPPSSSSLPSLPLPVAPTAPRASFSGCSVHLSRVTCYCLLYFLFLNTVETVVHSSTSSLNDVIVHEGQKARFLCYTSSLLTNSQQQQPPSSPSREKYDIDPKTVDVTWSFAGQPLDFDLGLEGQRVRSTRYDDRHVLEIGHVRRKDAGEYACAVTSPTGRENIFKGTLSVQSVPDPPIEVEVKSCHGNSAEISWKAGNSNGADIINFSIQFNISDKPDTWFDFYEDIAGDARKAFVELSPYGKYTFRVLAWNAVGKGAPSNGTARQCTTPPDRPDRNPTRVTTKTDKKGYLVIQWEPLHRLSLHGPGFHYIVLWRLKGSLAWNTANVLGANATSYEHKVEPVYATYELKVEAANDMGKAHQPAFVYVGKSFEAEPELVVSNFRLDRSKPMTSTTLHLAWEAVDPADDHIRGKFRGYTIVYWRWYGRGDRDETASIFVPGHGLKAGQEVKAAVSDLPPFSSIRFQVAVKNEHYTGPPSNVVGGFTPEGVPSKVRKIELVEVTPHSILLSWVPPDEPNGVIIGFDVGMQEVIGNHLGRLRGILGTDPRQFRRWIGSLKPNTRYRVTLVAKTEVGQGKMAYIDVRTASKRTGRNKNKQGNGGRLSANKGNRNKSGRKWKQSLTNQSSGTGWNPSAARKESSADTDRMLPDDPNCACHPGVSKYHLSVFIVVSSFLVRFLTTSVAATTTTTATAAITVDNWL